MTSLKSLHRNIFQIWQQTKNDAEERFHFIHSYGRLVVIIARLQMQIGLNYPKNTFSAWNLDRGKSCLKFTQAGKIEEMNTCSNNKHVICNGKTLPPTLTFIYVYRISCHISVVQLTFRCQESSQGIWNCPNNRYLLLTQTARHTYL